MTEKKILTDEQIEQISQQHLWAHAQFVGAGEVHVEGVNDFARAVEQAVLQSPGVVAMRWQPVETAPHGERVLLGWLDWDGAWVAEVGFATWGWRTDSVSNMSAHGQATHWMPLPAPPSDAAMQEQKDMSVKIPKPLAYVQNITLGRLDRAGEYGSVGAMLYKSEIPSAVTAIIATDQAEAYANARVREALEEAANLAMGAHDDASPLLIAAAIRALIPQEGK